MVALEKSENDNKFFGLYSYLISGDDWQAELYEYLFYSVIAIIAACGCFAALYVNLRPPGIYMIRFKLFISTLMIFVNNAMAIIGLRGSIVTIMNKTETDIGVIIGESYLSIMILICIIITDIVFVKYFGFCLFFTCHAFEPVAHHPTMTLEEGLSATSVDENFDDMKIENVIKKSRGIGEEDPPVIAEDNKVVDLVEDASGEDPEIIIEEEESSREIVDNVKSNEEIRKIATSSSIDSGYTSSTGHSTTKKKHLKWNTKRMLKIYKKAIFNTRQEINKDEMLDDALINKEDNEEEEEEEVPRPEDLTWFVYSMKNPRSLFHKLIDAVKEEEDFKYSIWIKSSAITTAVVLIYTAIYTMAAFDKFCVETESNLNGFRKILIELNIDLTEYGYLSESSSEFVSNVINYFIVILPMMRRTAYIGQVNVNQIKTILNYVFLLNRISSRPHHSHAFSVFSRRPTQEIKLCNEL